MCDFCEHYVQDILHLFWECEKVKKFWSAFMIWIKTKCSHLSGLELDSQLVILGQHENTTTDKGFNLLLLMAKFYIYKCKIQDKKFCLEHFKNDVVMRYNVEKCIAYTHCNVAKFSKMWTLYLDLLI